MTERVEITEPYKGVARIKFSTGLRVDISDRTKDDGRLRLYINVAGHGEDSGHDTIFIRPEAANSFTIFFDNHELGEYD